MQSIFRLAWSSDPPGGGAEHHATALPPCHPAPPSTHWKRKRTDSCDSSRDFPIEREIKRKAPCDNPASLLPHPDLDSWQAPAQSQEKMAAYPDLVCASSHTTSASPMPGTRAQKSTLDDGAPLALSQIVPSARSFLSHTIEHQFNLEILLKHRELRLIEQELAKCQVALEQLRRCELVPFPASQDFSAHVASGTGPAVRAQPGFSQPVAPAPWGVVDGPYTKHYASWLLPDPRFDSAAPPQLAPQDSAVRADGRPSRGSVVAWTKPTKARTRDSISLQEIGASTPTPVPRNKGGPLVLKRLSDNQFVKLVCVKCHRSDFSSVQGFLNHCRIAHKLDYKSHEAAAQECGQPLEAHETALASTAPPPVGTTLKMAAPKAAPAPPPPASKVHQFNQDIMPRPTWKYQRLEHIKAMNDRPHESVKRVKVEADPDFRPSGTTPFLSTQLARNGLGIDLAAIVAKLGEKVDLGFDQDDGEENQDPASPVKQEMASSSRSSNGAKLGGDRFGARKYFNQNGHRPQPPPLSQLPGTQRDEMPCSPQDSSLSPHGNDSNPGLVSDHDDDPASDSEETGSFLGPSGHIHLHTGCVDSMDLDMQVDDDRDDQAVIIRPRDSMQSDDACVGGTPSRKK